MLVAARPLRSAVELDRTEAAEKLFEDDGHFQTRQVSAEAVMHAVRKGWLTG